MHFWKLKTMVFEFYLFFTKKDTTKILFQEGESHCLKKKKSGTTDTRYANLQTEYIGKGPGSATALQQM